MTALPAILQLFPHWLVFSDLWIMYKICQVLPCWAKPYRNFSQTWKIRGRWTQWNEIWTDQHWSTSMTGWRRKQRHMKEWKPLPARQNLKTLLLQPWPRPKQEPRFMQLPLVTKTLLERNQEAKNVVKSAKKVICFGVVHFLAEKHQHSELS